MAEQNPSLTRAVSRALIADARQLIVESEEIALRSEQHIVEIDERIAASYEAIAESRIRLMRHAGGGVAAANGVDELALGLAG